MPKGVTRGETTFDTAQTKEVGMYQANRQEMARMLASVQKILDLIASVQLPAENFSNVSLLPEFRDAPHSPYAIAVLFPEAPIYGAFVLDQELDQPSIARKIRAEIPTYTIRESALRSIRQVRGEFITEDTSSGSLGNEVIWMFHTNMAIARGLPIAFILYSKYADDGTEAASLYFPLGLLPDDVLTHFRRAIQAE